MITIIIAIHKIEPGPPVFRATAVPEIFPTPKFPPKIVNRAAIEENLFSPFLAPMSERASAEVRLLLEYTTKIENT